MQEMNQSRWKLPGGYPNTINYMYIKLGDWEQVALLLQSDLAKIGIRINPVGINNIDDLYTEQGRDNAGNCISQTTFSGGPFPIGQEFYTSDYISPDDWTQNNAISYGSANDCMSAFNDPNVDAWVLQAAGESNPAVARQLYRDITRTMYDNYTNVWLLSPNQFSVSSPLLLGVIPNPMGSALPFTMSFNTEYALKP